MVLTMSRVRGESLDPKRVFAIAGVLLIHIAVLAAMLLPRQPAELWKPVPPEIEVSVRPSDPPPPPKPPEPVLLPPTPLPLVVVAPPQAPMPAPVPIAPVVNNTIVVDTPGEPVVPNAIVDESAAGPAPGTPGNLLALKALRAPPPAYPRRELARGIEGEVVLRVLVGVDGLAHEIAVIGGSGNRNLELAAIRALKRWRFQPHQVDGRPMPAWARVPLRFTIED